jgi:hypothetical protein
VPRLINTLFWDNSENLFALVAYYYHFDCHLDLKIFGEKMDITRQSFYYLLPRILHELADCDFLALDLELSGISLKPTQGVPIKGSSRKQTLQQRYEEVKEAAERYTILQIGLTVVKEDAKTGWTLIITAEI